MGLKSQIKGYFKRRTKIDALKDAFLQANSPSLHAKNDAIVFSTCDAPVVSIIIVWDQPTLNRDCFAYLKQNTTVASEVIVIVSTGNNKNSLNSIEGIRIIEGDEDLISKINKAISLSKGKFIYALNAKYNVGEEYLEALLNVFDKFPDCSIAGSQVISNGLTGQGLFFNGSLHENYTKNSYNPGVNFTRRTDFFEDFSFLIKKNDKKGETFFLTNAYSATSYAIATLCFDLKFNQQQQVYITPFSKIYLSNPLHKNNLETPDSVKFRETWLPFLHNAVADSAENRIQELYDRSVVILCRSFPEHDKDSGSNRLKEIIESFRKLNYFVILYGKGTFSDHPYLNTYLTEGTNAYYEFDKRKSIKNYLLDQKITPEFFWYYGPIPFIGHYKMARKYFPKSKLVYDMVDIHHLRFKRAMELDPKRISLLKKFKYHKKIEIKASRIADCLIAISEFEKDYMSNFCDVQKIKIISNVHYPKINKEKTLPFEARKNILFIGSIHAPNIDSLHYLFDDIMPLVWDKIPDLKVNIIGNVKDSIKDINHPNFIFLGYLPAIEDYFISSKFMVAPLRYGAGVKGKIGQSLEYYLPIITSAVGAEGMKLRNGESALIEDSTVGFAKAVINLYTNKELWEKLQDNSEKSLEPFSKRKVETTLKNLVQP